MVALLGMLVPGSGALSAFGIGLTTSTGALTAAGLLVNAAGSLILANALKPRASNPKQELAVPATNPAKRFVYGETRATGTPWAFAVNGGTLYGVWVLNSRASALPDMTLYLNETAVPLSGDPFDLSGAGASASSGIFHEHVTVWIGRGDQTSPPQAFLDGYPYDATERPDGFKASDKFRGHTFLFAKLNIGKASKRSERWPSFPPAVGVEGKYSLLYDPRTGVTAWSDNHALCALDALRSFPAKPYGDVYIDMGSFEDGADVCAQSVALNSGGTEKRYTCHGTLIFSEGTELEDALGPLMQSAAARFRRSGQKLGYVPAVWVAPAATITDVIDDGLSLIDMDADRPTQIRVTYTNPERGYETASLAPWDVPDATGAPNIMSMDLPFCGSATQAMRVRKIEGLRAQQVRTLSATALPDMLILEAGDRVTLDMLPALDGTYEVQSAHIGFDPMGDQGVAMRVPVTLKGDSADTYAWEAWEEEVIIFEPYDPDRTGVLMPGVITITTGSGANLNTGGTIIPRVLFEFAPSASAGVEEYGWRYRETGGTWQNGGLIDAETLNGSGNVYGYLTGSAGTSYDIQVWAQVGSSKSDPREYDGATPVVNISLNLPTQLTATPGSGQILVSVKAPNDTDVRQIEIWAGPTNSVGAAALLGDAIAASPNTTYYATETGLSAGQVRYYFARSRGDYNSASAFTAAVSATAS